MDAFAVLGLTPSLKLDGALLEQRYRDLQRQLHPDKFVNAAPSVRRESLARAVSVNEAYRLLRDEVSRAELLLSRYPGHAPAEGAPDPAFLMEMMELREQLAEAKAGSDLARVGQLATTVSGHKERASSDLADSFQALESGLRDEAIRRAQAALARLRYYRRFEEEVAAIEDAALR